MISKLIPGDLCDSVCGTCAFLSYQSHFIVTSQSLPPPVNFVVPPQINGDMDLLDPSSTTEVIAKAAASPSPKAKTVPSGPPIKDLLDQPDPQTTRLIKSVEKSEEKRKISMKPFTYVDRDGVRIANIAKEWDCSFPLTDLIKYMQKHDESNLPIVAEGAWDLGSTEPWAQDGYEFAKTFLGTFEYLTFSKFESKMMDNHIVTEEDDHHYILNFDTALSYFQKRQNFLTNVATSPEHALDDNEEAMLEIPTVNEPKLGTIHVGRVSLYLVDCAMDRSSELYKYFMGRFHLLMNDMKPAGRMCFLHGVSIVGPCFLNITLFLTDFCAA